MVHLSDCFFESAFAVQSPPTPVEPGVRHFRAVRAKDVLSQREISFSAFIATRIFSCSVGVEARSRGAAVGFAGASGIHPNLDHRLVFGVERSISRLRDAFAAAATSLRRRPQSNTSH